MKRTQLLAMWAWAVSTFLVLVGMIGLFTDQIGPLPTNRLHALGLNLGVGLVGFGFARFSREDVFVLLAGIGMVIMALLGYLPGTGEHLYAWLHMNRAESAIELGTGVLSLGLWATQRR